MVTYVENRYLLSIDGAEPKVLTSTGIACFLQWSELIGDEPAFRLYAFSEDGGVHECKLRALPMKFDGEDWGDAQFMVLDSETNVQVGMVSYQVDGRV